MNLPLPKLLDLTQNGNCYIKIITTTHKFAPDAGESGKDQLCNPIFGSKYYADKKKVGILDFGLPFIRFKQGISPNLKISNKTGFSFDLHWHGLNIPADIDGASTQLEFGEKTQIGTELNIPFPKITNNSALLWYHAHPMFMTSEFAYRGVYGLAEIVDERSEFMQKMFHYGDNHIMLVYEDAEFKQDGTLDGGNLYTDAARFNFGLINGISCVSWYADQAKYTTRLYHKTKKNLVKIDILNGTESFRNLYLGVCDEDNKIKPFYVIQTDNGLRNPTKLTMLSISSGNRYSLLIDLNKFKKNVAYLFFYNYDLTEVFNMELNQEGELVALVPDLSYPNPTPYPTPIPAGPNPEDIESGVTYPELSLIPQVEKKIPCGKQEPPKSGYGIKKFLEIKLTDMSFGDITKPITKIRKTVFGKKNYKLFKKIINSDSFEYNNQVNYLSILNDRYFYNLPNINDSPIRNFLLVPDSLENYVQTNPNGTTEVANEVNRVFQDMWNSEELDLPYAIKMYNLSPNNFKPDILPTCLFKITKTDNTYSNTSMFGNDTLVVQLYDTPIQYSSQVLPLTEKTLVFPSTNKPININQLINLINTFFANNTILINNIDVKISNLLSIDWTFFPLCMDYLNQKSEYIKTVMMKVNNKSQYYVKLIGNWQLLQFFGKPLSADMETMCDCCNECGCGACCMCSNENLCDDDCHCNMENNMENNMVNNMENNMGNMNKNMNLQMIFPFYASEDPDSQIMTDNIGNAQLIIRPNSIYLGFIDGFQSDNLMNFSVRVDSSEKWYYHNMDAQDSHPFHFHLTSGFADPSDSNCLISADNAYNPYLYSKDTYAIGSQQTLAFYLKFANYNSDDGGLNPPINYLGYMVHCHYIPHHDMNMMSEYFVYKNRQDYF